MSFGIPTRLLKRNSSFAICLAFVFLKGDGFRIPGGIVYYDQDVLVSSNTLGEWTHNIHPVPFKWGFYDSLVAAFAPDRRWHILDERVGLGVHTPFSL